MDRVPTGIKGLDELLGGGFPEGKCILVVGSPGSGKTTFAIQYLYSDSGEGIGFTDVLKTLTKLVEGENVERIALDPITSVMLRYGEELKRRRATVEFFDALADTGCTSLVTSELKTSLLDRRFQLEEFLSHGVVVLHTLMHQGNFVRAVQVEKMRGISHDTQIRPYQFGTSGIEVFPRDKVF